MNGFSLMKQEEDNVCLLINGNSCQKKPIPENKVIGRGRAEEEKEAGEESGEVLVVDASWGFSGLFFLDIINNKISLALLAPILKERVLLYLN